MHPQTLRVYERRGLITPRRSARNTRLYSEADVALLRRIQELSEEGLNLAGVERVLEAGGAPGARRAARPRPGRRAAGDPRAAPRGAGGRARGARADGAWRRAAGRPWCRATRSRCRAGRRRRWEDRPDGGGQADREGPGGDRRVGAPRGRPRQPGRWSPSTCCSRCSTPARAWWSRVLQRAGADMPALRAATVAAIERRAQVSGAAAGAQLSNAFRAVLRRAGQEAERPRRPVHLHRAPPAGAAGGALAGPRGAARQRRHPRRPAGRAAVRCAARRA